MEDVYEYAVSRIEEIEIDHTWRARVRRRLNYCIDRILR
jgi:hypothetical protein